MAKYNQPNNDSFLPHFLRLLWKKTYLMMSDFCRCQSRKWKRPPRQSVSKCMALPSYCISAVATVGHPYNSQSNQFLEKCVMPSVLNLKK